MSWTISSFVDKAVFFAKLEFVSRCPTWHYPFVMIIASFGFYYEIVSTVAGIVLGFGLCTIPRDTLHSLQFAAGHISFSHDQFFMM